MKRIWIFNDTHIGVRRTGGTTAASSAALRAEVQAQFRYQLSLPSNGDDVIINGDLTDQFSLDLNDTVELLQTLQNFLADNPASRLALCTGNHDRSKRSDEMGTVEFLGRLLEGSPNVLLVQEPADLGDGVYVIPHLVNQVLFDQALLAVPQDTKFLLLHCNAMSSFAEHSDHSLNLSREQALELTRRGVTIILGHEHHPRDLMGGKLVIAGNQFPTSIADCVTPEGRFSTRKDCLVIDGGEVKRVPTWTSADTCGFHPIDVHGLMADGCAAYSDLLGFVRVTGEVEAEQAADALRAISRLRQTCNAFVVGNSIKVRHGGEEIEGILDGVEDVRKVDVVSMLMEALTEEQREAVKALLALQT